LSTCQSILFHIIALTFTDSGSNKLRSSIAIRGVESTRRKWEGHWGSALPDERLSWLREMARCTTIRLPVGYFTLGLEYCGGTPFVGDMAKVYINAWTAVKKLVARCLRFGIGVLIDFHALPGGANSDAHSGMSSGKSSLWTDKANMDLAMRCLCFMAKEIETDEMDGVVGLQICNEAKWNAPGMYEFYDRVIKKLSEIDTTLPIYISDSWNLRKAVSYAIQKNSVKAQGSNPVIVDTHQYYTFAEKHTSQSPQQLIAQVSTALSELEDKDIGGLVFKKQGE
jgi:aryl-phospho-beta-D-glucosidase BglC (GH1 family)